MRILLGKLVVMCLLFTVSPSHADTFNGSADDIYTTSFEVLDRGSHVLVRYTTSAGAEHVRTDMIFKDSIRAISAINSGRGSNDKKVAILLKDTSGMFFEYNFSANDHELNRQFLKNLYNILYGENPY